MKTILQRLCWNNDGWNYPTGSVYESAFPGEEGYGHEEWNFNIGDTYNNSIFLYMRRRPSPEKLSGEDSVFRVVFFAKNPVTESTEIVGIHNHVELSTASECLEAYNYLEETGGIDRRASELCRVVDDMSFQQARCRVVEGYTDHLLILKSKTSEIQYFDTPKPISVEPYLLQFSRFKYLTQEEFECLDTSISNPVKALASALSEDGYPRETTPTKSIILPLHNCLSNKFAAFLRDKGAAVNQEENYVDILFTLKQVNYIAEIKITTHSTTRHGIREALGQLLEYNYYPNREYRNEWLIVLDKRPNDLDIQYISTLKQKLLPNLNICWENDSTFDFLFNFPF